MDVCCHVMVSLLEVVPLALFVWTILPVIPYLFVSVGGF
jgi:hypothetical protein